MAKIDLTKYCGASHTRDTHLLALEIAAIHRTGQSIFLSLDPEGWDIVDNGIERVVKDIADNLHIPYSNITFGSTDRLCKSETFKVKQRRNGLLQRDMKPFEINPPNENNFGLFVGRGTNERLYAFWKAIHFKNSVITCNVEIDSITEHACDFTPFICEHNEKWEQIKSVLPYRPSVDKNLLSERDRNQTVRFANDRSWRNVYANINVEIVCETNTSLGTFFMTEKIFRPIYYGRLFLVIGSPEFESNLNQLGFDTFDDILDKTYDTESSYIRVDKVFNSLQKFMQNPVDYSSITDRLKNNQQRLIELANE